MTNSILTIVISLPRASERRRNITSQLDKQKIPFEFLDATDLKNIDSDPLFKLYSRENFKRNNPNYRKKDELSQGEVACAISHYRAIKKLSKSDSDWALILEDDAQLITENTIAIIEKAINVSTKADIILLYSWCKGAYLPASIKIAPYPHKLHEPNKETTGAVAYLISKNAAAIISNEIESNGIIRASDWWIHNEVTTWSEFLKIAVIKPDLILESNQFASTIGHDNRAGCEGSSVGYTDPWFGFTKNMIWSWKKPYRWPKNIIKVIINILDAFFKNPPRPSKAQGAH